MDLFDLGGVLLALVFFWVPALCITVFSLVGFRRSRRRQRDGTASGKGVLLAALALALSAGGSALSLFALYGYAIGTGLGGYTPPLEAALFKFTMLSPSVAAVLASLASLVWLVAASMAWARRSSS